MRVRNDLSDFRIDQAEECLAVAKINFEQGYFRSAANRTYYCVFHSMRSLLALERKDFKSHYGVINEFRVKYIKTDILEKKLSTIIDDTFALRTDSDYKDLKVVSRDAVAVQIQNAEYFLSKIKEYLRTIDTRQE